MPYIPAKPRKDNSMIRFIIGVLICIAAVFIWQENPDIADKMINSVISGN